MQDTTCGLPDYSPELSQLPGNHNPLPTLQAKMWTYLVSPWEDGLGEETHTGPWAGRVHGAGTLGSGQQV